MGPQVSGFRCSKGNHRYWLPRIKEVSFLPLRFLFERMLSRTCGSINTRENGLTPWCPVRATSGINSSSMLAAFSCRPPIFTSRLGRERTIDWMSLIHYPCHRVGTRQIKQSARSISLSRKATHKTDRTNSAHFVGIMIDLEQRSTYKNITTNQPAS